MIDIIRFLMNSLILFISFIRYGLCAPGTPVGNFVKEYFIPFLRNLTGIPVIGYLINLLLKVILKPNASASVPLVEEILPARNPVQEPDMVSGMFTTSTIIGIGVFTFLASSMMVL